MRVFLKNKKFVTYDRFKQILFVPHNVLFEVSVLTPSAQKMHFKQRDSDVMLKQFK